MVSLPEPNMNYEYLGMNMNMTYDTVLRDWKEMFLALAKSTRSISIGRPFIFIFTTNVRRAVRNFEAFQTRGLCHVVITMFFFCF